MFLESFRHLIEIEALKRENQVNHLHISSENKRISDLDNRRHKSELLIETHKETLKAFELIKKQNGIEIQSTRLEKLKQQLNLSVTEKEENAFKSQIAHLEIELSEAENIYFEALEKSEVIEAEIEDLKTFLTGSLNTKNELIKEVSEIIAQEEKIILNRTLRINSLLEQCHSQLTSQYLEVEKRFSPKNAISYISEKKCTACFMQIDSILRQSIEEGRSIEYCPHCSRLLIPENAKNFASF